MTPSHDIHQTFHADGLLLLTAFIWGFAFVAQRVGMEHVGPFGFNGVRFALGCLVLLPLLWKNGIRTGGGSVSDQTNDQYIQYQATLTSPGTSTPTLSDVTMTYVVNATPEVQGVSASQGADGIVSVDYEVRDADSSTGTTPDQVTATPQYCTANCSDAGNETWTDAATVAGDLVSVDEVNWTALN